jgi:hypothetical protein
LLVLLWLFTAPAGLSAYIGPGAGISVIGTAVAFVGAVIFAIVGFVWYPIKRLLAFLRRDRAPDDELQPLP